MVRFIVILLSLLWLMPSTLAVRQQPAIWTPIVLRVPISERLSVRGIYETRLEDFGNKERAQPIAQLAIGELIMPFNNEIKGHHQELALGVGLLDLGSIKDETYVALRYSRKQPLESIDGQFGQRFWLESFWRHGAHAPAMRGRYLVSLKKPISDRLSAFTAHELLVGFNGTRGGRSQQLETRSDIGLAYKFSHATTLKTSYLFVHRDFSGREAVHLHGLRAVVSLSFK